MKTTKLGLLKIENNRITSVVYFESKFKRELGEEINYLGSKHTVAFIGSSRNQVIDALNDVIKLQNAAIRKQNRQAEAMASYEFNKILLESIHYVTNL